jgi:acetylornithine deacetylase
MQETRDVVAAVAAAVARRDDEIIQLARELIARRSTLGNEGVAQELVATYLSEAGFDVSTITPDTDALARDPLTGYPPLSYEGRPCVVAIMGNSDGGRSLHLSGHVDVVPVDPDAVWRRAPWEGTVAEGRLWGRGAGDMKGGLAAYLVAAAAAKSAVEEPAGHLVVSSVIEEECGGNGMWTVCDAIGADATLIGEPTGEALAYAGIGVVWLRLTATTEAAHAAESRRRGAFEELAEAIAALRGLERVINTTSPPSVYSDVDDWPYGMTVGEIAGGVWPSSAPASLHARVRLGFGPDRSVPDVQGAAVQTVAERAPNVKVAFEGFRAAPYQHDPDGPLGQVAARAHADVNGSPPGRLTWLATTDARFVDGDCLCYGPVAGNLHGADEWVDVASLRRVAHVVARVAAIWITTPPAAPKRRSTESY